MKQKQTSAPGAARSGEDEAAGSYYTMLIRRLRDGTFGEILDDWKWILGYTARYKGAVAFFILAGILSTSLGLVGSIASKYLIDIITGYQTDKLALLAILTVGSALASLLFSSLVERISVKLTLDINNDIQADIFDKIMDADWLSVSRFRSGDILNRFSADIRTVAGNAVGWLPKLIVALYRFTAIFCVLLFYDPPMAFLALGSAPILLLVSKALIRRQRMHSQRVKAMNSRLTAFEVETFYNFDTVKSFGIAPHYSGKLRELQSEHRGLSLDYQMFSLKTNILMTLVGMVIRYAAFGYCLWQLWAHTITYGTMTLFLQQHGSLSDAFSAVIGVIPVFLNSSVSAHRIRELTELPRERHMQKTSDGRSLPDLTGGVTVTLRNVDFSYEENRSVLSSSSLTAVPGEIIALVGASGEGKTTLVRLILGLVHPQSGIAVLKNAAGEEIPLNADIRYLFSYVPQGNTILSGTVADNLRMVKEDASPEEMESALRTACAWEFVSALPKGMDTDLGERGRGLSEGQSQRIAIARAVLRDAPILLLDEATSALDVATERKVLKNLMDGRPDRTCIVTTHRPSVLSLCKRVYRVMDTHVEALDEETSARMAMEF